jgi:hypothetical protein
MISTFNWALSSAAERGDRSGAENWLFFLTLRGMLRSGRWEKQQTVFAQTFRCLESNQAITRRPRSLRPMTRSILSTSRPDGLEPACRRSRKPLNAEQGWERGADNGANDERTAVGGFKTEGSLLLALLYQKVRQGPPSRLGLAS